MPSQCVTWIFPSSGSHIKALPARAKFWQSTHIHLTPAHTHADGQFWDTAGRCDFTAVIAECVKAEEAGSQLICAAIYLGRSPICEYVNYQKYNYSLVGGDGGGGFVLFPNPPSLPHLTHKTSYSSVLDSPHPQWGTWGTWGRSQGLRRWKWRGHSRHWALGTPLLFMLFVFAQVTQVVCNQQQIPGLGSL